MGQGRLFYLISFVLLFSSLAKGEGVKGQKIFLFTGYLKNTYGHLHERPSKNGAVLTTISCGHPLKVYGSNVYGTVAGSSKKKLLRVDKVFRDEWLLTKAGPYEGYVRVDFVDKSAPKNCLQDLYPRFFEKLDLSISDMYHWGRLEEFLVSGRSEIQ